MPGSLIEYLRTPEGLGLVGNLIERNLATANALKDILDQAGLESLEGESEIAGVVAISLLMKVNDHGRELARAAICLRELAAGRAHAVKRNQG